MFHFVADRRFRWTTSNEIWIRLVKYIWARFHNFLYLFLIFQCRYRRLDRFQQDVFEVFDKARQLSRSDSEVKFVTFFDFGRKSINLKVFFCQIFEDAVELQQFFIKTRDELCKNGKYYYSPALQFDTNRFANVLDVQRKEKKVFEMKEDENMPDDPRLAPSEKKVR